MRPILLVGPGLLLLLWFVFTGLGLVSPLFLPAPQDVLLALIELVQTMEFWASVTLTSLRILVAFGISFVLGAPIGLALGYFRRLYLSTEVLIDFFRSLPALALFPLMLLIFGIGDASKLATAVIAAGLVVVVSALYGVLNGRRTRRLTLRILGASKWEEFRHVVVPGSLPELFGGLRIAVSLATAIIIVTEMFVGTQAGIGREIFQSQLTYRVPELYAWILVAGTIGYAFNRILQLADSKFIHWRGE